MQPVAAADDDWSVDTSEEAVQKRMGNLTSGVKGLALTDDTEKTQEERFNLFYSFVKVTKYVQPVLIVTFLSELFWKSQRALSSSNLEMILTTEIVISVSKWKLAKV